MPSQDFQNETERLMDQPNLAPSERDAIRAEMGRREREYEDRHRAPIAEAKKRTEAQIAEHTASSKERLVNELMPLLEKLRAGHLSVKQALELDDALGKFADFIEGREDGRWTGIANTYDQALAKADEILADPGAWADMLAKKYPEAYPDRFVTTDDVHRLMKRMHGRSS